mmetsp:Transcript_37014/g.86395  ORF Transcript_37014/g.86395 Transcript_37014/m.86395 type:complete len:216 (-) Transcript_37014:1113-1760(-)
MSSFVQNDFSATQDSKSPVGLEFRHRQTEENAGSTIQNTTFESQTEKRKSLSLNFKKIRFRSNQGHTSLFGSPQSIASNVVSTKLNEHKERAVRVSTMIDQYSLYPLVLIFSLLSGSLVVFIIALFSEISFNRFEIMFMYLINLGFSSSGIMNAIVLLTSPHVISRWKSGSHYEEMLENNMFWRDDDGLDNISISSSDFAEVQERTIANSQDIFF